MSNSVYWNYAMTIPLEEIVYLHCHQQGRSAPNLSPIYITIIVILFCFLCLHTIFGTEIVSCMSSAVDSGGTVVLVSQDGIQRPPLRFPRGGHLLQFLSCLENGLLPHGQLDPPLWSQRGKVSTGGTHVWSLSSRKTSSKYQFSLIWSINQYKRHLHLGIDALPPCCVKVEVILINVLLKCSVLLQKESI